ncbi:MAG: hypothetical protein ACAH59_09740, partial [Pseudobdellovibrionaceae bacterium]
MKWILSVFSFLMMAEISHAACDQTLSPGANVASAVSSAPAGATICLNAGSYGNVQFTNFSKSPRVTVQSVSGRTATLSANYYNASGIDLKSLTISGLDIRNGSRNITAQGNTFTGQTVINMGSNGGNYGDANILLDGNTFDGISVCTNCYEGRVEVISSLPCGVTISNNHFGGAGESDGIQMSAKGLKIGPGNVFEGIIQGNYGRHVDAIQGVGQSGTIITGNYFFNNTINIGFYDGGSSEQITHNVFGPPRDNLQNLQLGGIQGMIMAHNTFRNTIIAHGTKSGDTANSGWTVRDNIFVNSDLINSGDQLQCNNCVYNSNLFDASSSSRGTNALIGSPTFVGGSAPSTWAGYQLTSSSLGYRAASDGLDLGPSSFGGTPPPPPPVSLAAPTNLRVVSLAYNQVKVQWDSSSSSQSGFIVNRKAGSGSYAQAASVSSSTLSYTDAAVAASTQYCYQVKAYDSSSQSA